ncbi:MAG: hypothetical protein K2X38_04540 [Gemmataceae bacterium]|nr:hypothetical protein [Gemmataceae bacterium]
MLRFFRSIRDILLQRCPQCRIGPIYRRGMDMHDACPQCGEVFAREVGYFVGSMYVSYALASVLMGLLTLAGSFIWPEVDLSWIVLGAIVLFAPFAPAVARYSRIIWIYADRWIWPTDAEKATGAPRR